MSGSGKKEAAPSRDEERDDCRICLGGIEDDEMGKIECCKHVFHFGCILDWSKQSNTCPLCKKRFNKISKAQPSPGRKRARTVRVKKVDQRVPDDDDMLEGMFDSGSDEDFQHQSGDIVCSVCGGVGDEAVLLLCDLCNGGYHTYCLTPPLESVPVNNWFCETCVDEQKRIATGQWYPSPQTVSWGRRPFTIADVSPRRARAGAGRGRGGRRRRGASIRGRGRGRGRGRRRRGSTRRRRGGSTRRSTTRRQVVVLDMDDDTDDSDFNVDDFKCSDIEDDCEDLNVRNYKISDNEDDVPPSRNTRSSRRNQPVSSSSSSAVSSSSSSNTQSTSPAPLTRQSRRSRNPQPNYVPDSPNFSAASRRRRRLTLSSSSSSSASSSSSRRPRSTRNPNPSYTPEQIMERLKKKYELVEAQTRSGRARNVNSRTSSSSTSNRSTSTRRNGTSSTRGNGTSSTRRNGTSSSSSSRRRVVESSSEDEMEISPEAKVELSKRRGRRNDFMSRVLRRRQGIIDDSSSSSDTEQESGGKKEIDGEIDRLMGNTKEDEKTSSIEKPTPPTRERTTSSSNKKAKSPKSPPLPTFKSFSEAYPSSESESEMIFKNPCNYSKKRKFQFAELSSPDTPLVRSSRKRPLSTPEISDSEPSPTTSYRQRKRTKLSDDDHSDESSSSRKRKKPAVVSGDRDEKKKDLFATPKSSSSSNMSRPQIDAKKDDLFATPESNKKKTFMDGLLDSNPSSKGKARYFDDLSPRFDIDMLMPSPPRGSPGPPSPPIRRSLAFGEPSASSSSSSSSTNKKSSRFTATEPTSSSSSSSSRNKTSSSSSSSSNRKDKDSDFSPSTPVKKKKSFSSPSSVATEEIVPETPKRSKRTPKDGVKKHREAKERIARFVKGRLYRSPAKKDRHLFREIAKDTTREFYNEWKEHSVENPDLTVDEFMDISRIKSITKKVKGRVNHASKSQDGGDES